MVYQRASSSLGTVSSRISLRTDGAMSAMPISSGSSISPLCMRCVSFIREKLPADNATHHRTEEVIKETDEKRERERDADDDERVRERGMIRRPDNVRELFAHMLQIGEGLG